MCIRDRAWACLACLALAWSSNNSGGAAAEGGQLLLLDQAKARQAGKTGRTKPRPDQAKARHNKQASQAKAGWPEALEGSKTLQLSTRSFPTYYDSVLLQLEFAARCAFVLCALVQVYPHTTHLVLLHQRSLAVGFGHQLQNVRKSTGKLMVLRRQMWSGNLAGEHPRP